MSRKQEIDQVGKILRELRGTPSLHALEKVRALLLEDVKGKLVFYGDPAAVGALQGEAQAYIKLTRLLTQVDIKPPT